MDHRRLLFSRLLRKTQERIATVGAMHLAKPSPRLTRELGYLERRYDWLRRTLEALPRDDPRSAATDNLPRLYDQIQPLLPSDSTGDEKQTAALIFKEEARQLRSLAATATEYADLRLRALDLADHCSALAGLLNDR